MIWNPHHLNNLLFITFPGYYLKHLLAPTGLLINGLIKYNFAICLMASTSGNEKKTVPDSKPCLPSSALIPLLESPVQGDTSKHVNSSGQLDSEEKIPRKPRRTSKKSPANRSKLCHIDSLFCGCLSRHGSTVSSHSPKTPKHQTTNNAEKLGISTEEPIQSSEHHNASSSSSEPHTVSDEQDDSATCKDDERPNVSFFKWSPFSRLRFYLARRRNRAGGSKSDIQEVSSDPESRDAADIDVLRACAPKPSPEEGDQKENVSPAV